MLPDSTDRCPGNEPVNVRRKIFEFLASRQADRKHLPTQAEIRKIFSGMTDDVHLHLERLAREGLILLDRDGGNGISLVPTYTPAPQIELFQQVAHQLARKVGGGYGGSIALDLRGAGIPMEKGISAVQVLDDRMSDADIRYGDLALVVHTTPMRGQIVAVDEAKVRVLRRYIVISGIPHFLAENPATPELRPAWDQPICGVFWGLIRVESRRRTARPQPTKLPASYRDVARDETPSEDDLSGARRAPTLLARNETSPKIKNLEKRRVTIPKQPAKTEADWPRPPWGIQLNEGPAQPLLTDETVQYDSWGSRYPEE